MFPPRWFGIHVQVTNREGHSELGVTSLQTARFIGADIQPDTQFTDEPNITTHLCDSTNPESVADFMKKLGDVKFDIIIDDGSHIDTNQLKTLLNFYSYVKDGGFYIIEDIYPGSKVSTMPQLLETLCGGDPYFFVGLKNNICVIYKNHLKRSEYRINY